MKKKIEKEETNYANEYLPVIRAFIVLIVLVGLLVGVMYYQPTKKDIIEEPSNLKTTEKEVNTDVSCDGDNAIAVKKDADRITISYDVIDDYFFGYASESDEDLNGNGIIDQEPVIENIGYALKVNLSNLTSNNYVVITNNLDEETKIFHDTDKNEDGIVSWYESDVVYTRTYDVKVYSNKDECKKNLYREFKLTLPKYNINSRADDCQLDFAKDLEACQPFIFSDKKSTEELRDFRKAIMEAYNKYEEEQKKKEDTTTEETKVEEGSIVDKITQYVKDNYLVVAIIGGAIAALIIIFIIKKGRR